MKNMILYMAVVCLVGSFFKKTFPPPNSMDRNLHFTVSLWGKQLMDKSCVSCDVKYFKQRMIPSTLYPQRLL